MGLSRVACISGMANPDVVCMLPAFDTRDCILHGAWDTWGEWLWFVWTYSSGWKEWFPAYQFLSRHARMPEHKDWDAWKLSIIQHLHAQHGLAPIRGEDVHHYISTQMRYIKHTKSDWWYNTLPQYSKLAAVACFLNLLLFFNAFAI